MQLIDGKATAAAIKAEIAEEVKEIVAKGGKQPHLAAVLVGHDGGSETYVKNKVLACEACGFKSSLIRYEEDVTEEELLACVDRLNSNGDVDGFIVQLPLPKHIDEQKIIEAIDAFHPSRMADRILGMGDVVSLVERAQEQYDEEEARRLQKKIAKNKFDFNDFLGQINQIKKMGNLKDLAAMIPGVGKQLKDIDIDDNAFKGIEAIIQSMTPKERSNPEILNQSRRMRIAKGSGTNIQEVNRLIKQFDQTRKMMKMVTGSGMRNMMGAMKNMKGGMPM